MTADADLDRALRDVVHTPVTTAPAVRVLAPSAVDRSAAAASGRGDRGGNSAGDLLLIDVDIYFVKRGLEAVLRSSTVLVEPSLGASALLARHVGEFAADLPDVRVPAEWRRAPGSAPRYPQSAVRKLFRDGWDWAIHRLDAGDARYLRLRSRVRGRTARPPRCLRDDQIDALRQIRNALTS
jgi:hypothetical protein